MKVFVIGGTTIAKDEPGYQEQLLILNTSMELFGNEVISRGHDLVACSPFPGSADMGAIRGGVKFFHCGGSNGSAIELHFPDTPEVRSQILVLTDNLSPNRCRLYPHPIFLDDQGQFQREYSWMLAQLAAMDRCHAILGLGGSLSGSANLSLTLAESRRKHILPLAFLGGAAAESFRRRRYELEDRLGDRANSLQQSASVREAVGLIEELTCGYLGKSLQTAPARFFLSYPRSRPEEADFVEMVLRRRNFEVYRDERDFAAGRNIPNEIVENIHSATVFIVIWCREYACSPWCHDEFSLALERSQAGAISLWIFCVDETRIIPPAARDLVNYPSRTREELERHVLTLLENSHLL